MPYDPYAIDEHQRSYQYKVIWFGAACSIVNFANAFIGSDSIVFAWALGGAVGGLVAGLWAHRVDDYFHGMVTVGYRWALASLAIYLFAAFTLDIFDVSYSAGFALSNPEGEPTRDTFSLFFTDARTLASFTVLAFHAGYAFAWISDAIEARRA
ncbi:hypothetical protein NAP1_05120 [Erythrobacter sp. NAP1]|uniref:hypothetical protein n=1 Tax=Erythrobacter sp. NAP1 TaxID=237727 RepID=UPI0000686A60|nr:hypothetical protein [Erythrobacter sp. NAP1]EAQ30130.1 hypothetical protein NAP1_05120 [Erythrobacter sp. NAP1]